MELTKEQIEILNSTGNIKINAVAGSGKTTTIIEYAKARPKDTKILYLAFNKSVKIEAIKKFKQKGLTNVQVETAHSLAFKHIVIRSDYKIKKQEYTSAEVVELLKLNKVGENLTEYVLANHILKFVAYFCNTDKKTVQELNYLDTIADTKAHKFVTSFYKTIEKQARIFLKKMNDAEIDITHDFYLKKFQLSNPKLSFDYILFDEGQDASPAMLDVFINQKSTKVIVGDTHQQIYGWRYAINSLEKLDFKTYRLSTSFRFSQDIANLAIEVLNYKKHLKQKITQKIIGKGTTATIQSKAVIARTNLGLLLNAIKYVTEENKATKIYFEGNFNSYTYADEGASLYDVLNLYNGKRHLINDKLIKAMKNLDELEDYIEKTEDVQLSMMVKIVKDYGNEIPEIIKKIKSKHVENEERDKAEIIFSTVHRCKGMEYDEIHLADDLISEEKLEKLTDEQKNQPQLLTKLNEEINLLYVAITRTKNKLFITEKLMPFNFPDSKYITKILEYRESEEDNFDDFPKKYWVNSKDVKQPKEKAYQVDEIRKKHKDAYKPWTYELDDELTVMFCEEKSIKEMAKHFGRTIGSITARVKKLELEEKYR